MGVHETSEPYRSNVTGRMARDRSGSEYSENMSDGTSCSCMTGSVDKCSLRSCGMFQEPFFLHPPGSRPRDGIYINPMSAYIAAGEPAKPPKDTESFYLHSPHDLVYTRITRLFGESAPEKHRNLERKDETLTVKVDVHINNNNNNNNTSNGNNNNGVCENNRAVAGNGYAGGREPSEHAYEQISCLRQEEPGNLPGPVPQKKIPDNVSESSRSRKTDRRYSRSSSASESSNMSSEVHCFSSSASTPSLSRHSSTERIHKCGKLHPEMVQQQQGERREPPGGQLESEKEIKLSSNAGPAFAKPPPPPPPPPPPLPEKEDVLIVMVTAKQTIAEPATGRDERKEGNEASLDGRNENATAVVVVPPSATNKSDVSCGEHHQPEVPPVSPAADTDETKPSSSNQSHLVNRHMVLPFIPPKFANADSNTLLKPSEYLKSICKAQQKNSLSKARSVDNLDIQSRNIERDEPSDEREKQSPPPSSGPPPPPLSPLQKRRTEQNSGATTATAAAAAAATTASTTGTATATSAEIDSPKSPQPLATISIQDLTSIQLRRTSTKMNATKTFSAPPPRSVSMTNVSEPFFVQKTDLIAELKRTKDIPGIKKLKVERAQVEKTQEQNLMSEINKAFSASNFVDQIPEKDSSGNVIPIWKRQMLARKAAERAKKELEEQIARENEERRQKAIPPWKRQLLAKKDNEEKRLTNRVQNNSTHSVPAVARPEPAQPPAQPSKPADSSSSSSSTSSSASGQSDRSEERRLEAEERKPGPKEDDSDEGPIMPWRAQLRKTNSKLNILD